MRIEDKLRAYGDVKCHEPLSAHTTFRIGGTCRCMVYPKNEICLMCMLDILKNEQIAYKILGKGSNILCADDHYDGVVICLDGYFTDFYFEDDGTCVAQAGCSIILLAHEAMKQSYSGLEFASGIPGTVGGAVFMNAGAYKSDMKEIIEEVFVLKDDACIRMKKEELDFSYRHSLFQQHPEWIILGVKLKLQQGNQTDIRELMDSRRKRRLQSQPLDLPSAGSMFRNPKQAQAWELIEKIGFRGKRVGGAMVSDKHANFIVNANKATARDVIQLVSLIQEEVRKQFGIELKTEVERFNWKI